MPFSRRGWMRYLGKEFIVYAHSSYLQTGRYYGDVLSDAFDKNPELGELKADHFIALLWSDEGKTCIDLWIISDLKDWDSNPEYDAKVFKDGNLVTDGGVTCGEGIMLIGREEEYRRKCKSLSEYLNLVDYKGPKLPKYLRAK